MHTKNTRKQREQREREKTAKFQTYFEFRIALVIASEHESNKSMTESARVIVLLPLLFVIAVAVVVP